MRRFVSLFGVLFFVFSVAQAQHEKIMPLETNPIIVSSKTKSIKQYSKTNANLPLQLPLVEHFDYNKLNVLFWLDSNVTVSDKTARFNAQTFTGATYNGGDGTFGENDVLTTKTINLSEVKGNFNISIAYETGSTWQVGDSLVLQAKNSAGYWDNIWRTVPAATAFRVAQLDLNIGLLYQHASFQFRFVSYSARTSVNTDNIRLFHFVFSPKITIPYYENVFWNIDKTYRNNWSFMQGDNATDSTIKWGNVIQLNAKDALNNSYNNGYGDTIQSHAIDLSNLAEADSVFFRMRYKVATASANDSLVVQFKSVGGAWDNVFGVISSSTSGWNTFATNVNRDKYNHANFEFRVFCYGSTNEDTKWVVSGFNISKRLMLPFVDDFSGTTIYPDQKNWMDKAVFVNNTFPINPPSINVATFDGLSATGVPYGVGHAACDTLTSFPINLNGLSIADSVYLSFFIQPKGLGMEPDLGDSLNLYARFSAFSPDSFNLLWRGAPSNYISDSFIQVRILLPAIYLHDEFQMKFINIGSKSGNLSHWHLDYIYLNKGRTATDAITDVAIQNTPSPLLKKFSSIPFTHFKTAAANYTKDTQYFTIKNNSNINYAIDYGREIFDQNFSRIDSFGSIIGVMPALQSRSGNIKKNINIAGSFTTDSVVVWSRFYTRLGANSDNIPSNDTLWQATYFGNYYAYDDGTAEAGYAIENSPGKVALRYPLIKPDSIYGIAVYFNRGKQDVSELPFSLMVWKKIELTTEEELLRIPAHAIYFNERNRFYYVHFAEPIYAENEIYIGWEQNSIFPLNVGLDLNFKIDEKYAPNTEMQYNVQGLWQTTQLNGALMMRPIVGKWIEPVVGVNEKNVAELNVMVYPNPANNYVNIQAENPLEIEVYDVSGRKLIAVENTKQIDVSMLPGGFYFVKILDRKTNLQAIKKVIIQKNE